MALPTDYAGLQFWGDASQEAYTDTQAADQMTDWSGNARHMTATTTARPTFRFSQFPLGGKAFDFDGSANVLSTTGDLSLWITASAYTIFGVVIIDAVSVNAANTYDNMTIWGENQGYAGTFVKSAPALYAYNWDATDDSCNVSISTATAFTFMQRHEGGTLYLSKNGAAETSVASGDTQLLTGDLRVGKGVAASVFLDGKIGELFVYNAARSTGEITILNDYLYEKWIDAGTPPPSGPPLPMRLVY